MRTRGAVRSATGAIVRLDPTVALHGRRRITELAGIWIGVLGFLAVMASVAFYRYLPPDSRTDKAVYIWLIAPLTLLMAGVGLAALRAIPSRHYAAFSVARHVIDVLGSGVTALTAPAQARPAAICLVTLCVLGAAARFGLGGALATWAATYGVGTLALLGAALLSPAVAASDLTGASVVGLAYGAPLGLLAAVVAGSRTGTAEQHLAALEQAQAALEYQAEHDGLTGLANRTLLYRHAATLDRPGALLAIDLDGFKVVNDTFGHAAGDAVLQAVAARLESVVGPGDLVARTGGDEFVILLADSDRYRAEAVGQAIGTKLAQPIASGVRFLGIGASIGIALVEGMQPWDLDALAATADARMYAAKTAARARRRQSRPVGLPLC